MTNLKGLVIDGKYEVTQPAIKFAPVEREPLPDYTPEEIRAMAEAFRIYGRGLVGA